MCRTKTIIQRSFLLGVSDSSELSLAVACDAVLPTPALLAVSTLTSMTKYGYRRRFQYGGVVWVSVEYVVSLAPSAYLTSAASTMELTSTLLPARLTDVEDSGIVATSVWTRPATIPTLASVTSTAPVTPTSHVQRRCMLQGAVRPTARLRNRPSETCETV